MVCANKVENIPYITPTVSTKMSSILRQVTCILKSTTETRMFGLFEGLLLGILYFSPGLSI